MRIVYLESTRDDLLWMRHYYTTVVPEGAKKAQAQFRATEKLLSTNPFMGHQSHRKNVLEYSIPRTPFSYIYKVTHDQITVLRIWDERRNR